MMTTEIAIVTSDELLYTAELMAKKLRAFELLELDSKEFLSGVTCLEAAALGWMGSFTPKALEGRGSGAIDEVPAEEFEKTMNFFLSVQNELISRGIDVRQVLSKDLNPEDLQPKPDKGPEVWTYGGRAVTRDIQEAFPDLEWEFERPSANSLVARSGPLTIECDDSLPEMFGIFCEFPQIPSLDFRASSAAEARSVLVELRDGLTGLLG